jgi:hypothetical protein
MIAGGVVRPPVIGGTKRSKQGGNAMFPPPLPSSAAARFEQSRADDVNTALGVSSGHAQRGDAVHLENQSSSGLLIAMRTQAVVSMKPRRG